MSMYNCYIIKVHKRTKSGARIFNCAELNIRAMELFKETIEPIVNSQFYSFFKGNG